MLCVKDILMLFFLFNIHFQLLDLLKLLVINDLTVDMTHFIYVHFSF